MQPDKGRECVTVVYSIQGFDLMTDVIVGAEVVSYLVTPMADVIVGAEVVSFPDLVTPMPTGDVCSHDPAAFYIYLEEANQVLVESFRPIDYPAEIQTMAKELVDKAIAENKVAVFSKSYCPFCTRVKGILKNAGVSDYYLLELDQTSEGDAIQNYLQNLTGGRTVPRVFVGGEFVGGCDDTEAKANSGELEKKLKNAGAI